MSRTADERSDWYARLRRRRRTLDWNPVRHLAGGPFAATSCSLGSNLRRSGPPSFAHECRRRMPRRSVASVVRDTKAGLVCPRTSSGSASHPSFAHECKRRMPGRSVASVVRDAKAGLVCPRTSYGSVNPESPASTLRPEHPAGRATSGSATRSSAKTRRNCGAMAVS